MAEFTLDDIRDTYTADMTTFVGSIETAARSLLDSQALSLAIPRSDTGRTMLEVIATHAHAIFGSSSLIGVKSMSEIAHVLEEAASRGHDALLKFEQQAVELRRIASLCSTAGRELKSILQFELDGKSEEAMAQARELLIQLEPLASAPAEPSSVVARARSSLGSNREFAFDDASAGGSGDEPNAGAVQDELLSVFQQEARESVVGLQGLLQALHERPNDLKVGGDLERIFHTLKGAAATVGLNEVSKKAHDLQALFEEVVEGGAKLDADKLEDAVQRTNSLLRTAGLPELTTTPSQAEQASSIAPAGGVEGDKTRSFFVEEALTIAREAGTLLGALASAGADRKQQLSRQLGQLFHRLKGSALVSGEDAIAEVALGLQQDAGSGADAEQLRSGLEKLFSLLPQTQHRPAPSMAAPSSNWVGVPRPRRTPEKVTVNNEPELWEAFTQECADLLEGYQREVLALEASTSPKQQLSHLMGTVHTLKGAVNSVGISPTGKMLHQVEDFLEQLAEAPILPSMRNVTALMLIVEEEVRINLKQAPTGSVDSSSATIAETLAFVMSGGREASSASSAPADAAQGPSRTSQTGGSTQPGMEDFGERRLIRVTAERLDELMNLSGELVVSRSRLLMRVAMLRSLQLELGRSRRKLFGRVDEFRERYEFMNLDGGKRPRAMAGGGTMMDQNTPVPLGYGPMGDPPTPSAGWQGFSDLELDRYEDVHILSRSLAEITDDLTEMDSQLARELSAIAEDSETFSTLISRIQSEVTRARMVPVESLFARLQLPIRDAADREHKDVQVKLDEASVNLDKTIVDSLYKPMLHLVRNAVHHGLEPSNERLANGKSRSGTLSLRARQESGQIVIEVVDDGRGLDLDALKAMGVARGLVSADTPLDSPLIKNLVFADGLSTAASVGAVAGRGVGGSVVKRAIERLNGDIRIETEKGKGTTFSITLPLTLLITQALLVKSGGRTFALPLFFAERIIELEELTLTEALGSRQVKLGDRYLPVKRIESLFGEDRENATGPVVVLRLGDRRLALQVDALQAREEIVVKSLGAVLSGHPLFAGVTLRGNGDLVLIVDVPGLLELAQVSPGRPTEAVRPSAQRPALQRSALPPKPPMPRLDAPSFTPASSEAASSVGLKTPVSSLASEAVPAPPAISPVVKPPPPVEEAGPRATGLQDLPDAEAFEEESVPTRRLPVQVVKLAQAAAAAPTATTSESTGKPRVLVVDDSLSVRKVAEKALVDLGVDVTLAVDGVDALEKLRTAEFDLVFTDLEMPRMHGYELIREVRFLPRLKNLPLVVVSSRAGTKHQDQARTLGATDYVTKPFTPQILDGVLRKYVKGMPKKG